MSWDSSRIRTKALQNNINLDTQFLLYSRIIWQVGSMQFLGIHRKHATVHNGTYNGSTEPLSRLPNTWHDRRDSKMILLALIVFLVDTIKWIITLKLKIKFCILSLQFYKPFISFMLWVFSKSYIRPHRTTSHHSKLNINWTVIMLKHWKLAHPHGTNMMILARFFMSCTPLYWGVGRRCPEINQ